MIYHVIIVSYRKIKKGSKKSYIIIKTNNQNQEKKTHTIKSLFKLDLSNKAKNIKY